jgi:hypothetical protein
MKLWLLRPAAEFEDGNNPWNPWYDKSFGFVIRAETESEARELAHANAGGEVFEWSNSWKDAKYSTCVELSSEGPAEVVMEDYHAA